MAGAAHVRGRRSPAATRVPCGASGALRLRRVVVKLLAALLTLGAAGAATAVASTAVPAIAVPATAVPATAVAVDVPGAEPVEPVELVRFTGDGCPKCQEQTDWLASVADRYPGLTIREHEVWGDAANRELFRQTGERLGFDASSVPTTVLGERVWIGWTSAIADDLEAALDRASRGEAVRPGVYGTPGAGTCSEELLTCDGTDAGATIAVPFLGDVDLGRQSLVMSTLIIGFVDGINPCSLWAISVLLTVVVRTRSRRRVLAIGTTFLLVTAGMYALYMAGIYSALTVAAHLGVIQLVVAVAAGVFGVVSVKDYFAFKKGISFTISDAAKPGLYQRMRSAAGHQRLAPALLATAALGVAVSLLEAPCTAGFPVLWTGLLQANGVAPAEAVGLFGLYMAPYLMDEFAVFLLAVATMRATRMQEKHGQVLKLVAGVTMLALAGAMVVDPTVMQDPVAALLLFLGAFAVTAATHAVTTRVRAARRGVDEVPNGLQGADAGDRVPVGPPAG
jgi:hypothetical protein